VVGDPKRNKTGQKRLEARLSLKIHNLNLKHKCLQCKKGEKDGKKGSQEK
jgi:hypothetical protein